VNFITYFPSMLNSYRDYTQVVIPSLNTLYV
jgi:hypothetical protein